MLNIITDLLENPVPDSLADPLLTGRRSVTMTSPPPSQAVGPDTGEDIPAGPPRTGGRVAWRTAGIGLTSLGAPVGIWAADPLLGQVAIAVELAVALTVIGTALVGSQALSERAFRLLRWLANRPEPFHSQESTSVS